MKHPIRIYKMIIVLMVTLLIIVSIPIKAASKTVIRVGYPLMNGLSMKDDDGNYYGYDYDYLMQIAQYTGWDYEFVEVEGDANQRITKLMSMLENGEIDLLGDMRYMESLTSTYDYSSEPYGNAYNILAVPNDSDIVDSESLFHKKNIRIAVQSSAKSRIALLDQYAEMNGFSFDKVECSSEEDVLAKVNNHEADAILTVDLNMPSNYISVARFSPDPYYFVTTKGNTSIIQEINQAIITINSINPTLSTTLYNRYFNGDTSNFVLNASEKSYVAQHSELTVLVRNGSAPIQYVIDGEPYGVGKELLDKVTEKTGMKCNYVYADTYEEYKEKALDGSIDIVLSIPYEIDIADTLNVSLSDSYITSNLVMVVNDKIDPTQLDDKRQATTPYNNTLYDTNNNIMYYETLEDALLAVDKGSVDYTFVNSYLYTYYLNKYKLRNVSSFASPEYLRSQYAFGVTKSEDLSLLSILNKTIRSQSSNIETYIYKNAYLDNTFSFIEFIQTNIIAVIMGFLLLAIIVVYLVRRYYKNQLKMKKAIELEYMRFQMLSDISKEMTFSYDYVRDEMKISNTGIGRLAKESIIHNFSTEVDKTTQYPEILRLIYGYIIDKQDTKNEQQSYLLNNVLNWYQISLKIINDVEKSKDIAIYAIGKVIDIQKDKEEREQLLLKSQTDILTGILNRGGAQDEITSAIEKEQGLGALIMIDLDNFKNVNDDFGHIEGDQVLIETAKLLKEIFQGHIVARLGGDEFIIYVSDTNKEQLHSLCDETLARIENLTCMKDKNLLLSLSMGIVYTTHSKNFLELLRRADEKLYEVKRNGRNNYRILEES